MKKIAIQLVYAAVALSITPVAYTNICTQIEATKQNCLLISRLNIL